MPEFLPREDEIRVRQLDGGWVAQVQGPPSIDWSSVKCVTNILGNDDLVSLARFGSTVLSEVKSNSIQIWIERNDEIVLWKHFSHSMPVSVEYNINF